MREVKFIRSTIDKPEASGEHTKLVYNIYEEWEYLEDLNFILRDIVDLAHDIGFIIDKLVEIQYIHVDYNDRGFGFGDEMLTQFLHNIGAESKDTNTIILVRAAPLKLDYNEEPPKGIYEDELIRQSLWLENRGFRNINSLCGFENGIPYMYINHSSKKLLEAIITREVTMSRNAIGACIVPNNELTEDCVVNEEGEIKKDGE